MHWIEIIASSLSTSILIGILGFIFREWLTVRLIESVADEYKKSMEKFKDTLQWETRRREQAIKVANLISLWLLKEYDKSCDPNKNIYQVQEKYWELALWLDAPILRELNLLFIKKGPVGIKHKETLVAIRKIIVGNEDDVRAEELVHWDPIV